MAPVHKLTYFDLPALGEPPRYLFAYGNVEFQDIRIKYQSEEWEKLKPSTPFGTLPTLEYNGKQVCESVAITKYVGKLVGLTGANSWEDLEIDSVVCTFGDFISKLGAFEREKDQSRKAELQKTLEEETIPFYMGRFENKIKKNNGYFVNGKLTWADVYITIVLKVYEEYLKLDIFSKYPAFTKLYETVISNENYKKWQKTVPKSS